MSTLDHADAPVRPQAGSLREIGWRMLVGLSAGALAGFVLGGGLGRLFMFVLRLTSPDIVVGLESDDGFVIGQFTAVDTLTLMLLTATLGGFAGVGYAAIRPLLPRRIRVAAWTVLAGTAGGAAIVHTDGVDFTLLRPTWLAVGGIVAVLALGGLVTALLVEQWSTREFDPRSRATWAIAAPAVLGLPALAAAVVATVALLAISLIASHLPPAAIGTLSRYARIVVIVAVAGLIALGVADLVRDLTELS